MASVNDLEENLVIVQNCSMCPFDSACTPYKDKDSYQCMCTHNAAPVQKGVPCQRVTGNK